MIETAERGSGPVARSSAPSDPVRPLQGLRSCRRARPCLAGDDDARRASVSSPTHPELPREADVVPFEDGDVGVGPTHVE